MATRKVKVARLREVKSHKKVPGFDAFSPHKIVVKKRRKGKNKTVPCEEIDEPEKGIHSLEWANAIVAQPESGFLKLPFEVRVEIYKYAIQDFDCGLDGVAPTKKGNKFRSPGWALAAQDTSKFILSRQMYVDFVGSSLLYRNKTFNFDSPNLMLNYLMVINPLHKNAITSITWRINLTKTSAIIPTRALYVLSKCESLTNLNIQMRIPAKYIWSGGNFSVTWDRPTVKTAGECALKRLQNVDWLRTLKILKLGFSAEVQVSTRIHGDVRARRVLWSSGDVRATGVLWSSSNDGEKLEEYGRELHERLIRSFRSG